MADALVITDTTYAGEAAGRFITQHTLELDTYKNNCLMIQDGIKKQFTIPRLDVSNIVQDRMATPTSQGTISVDGKQLVPKDYMVYVEFNPRDFETHWQAVDLQKDLIDRSLPPTANAFTVMMVLKRLIEFNEQAIWRSRIQFHPGPSQVTPASKGQASTDAQFCYFDGLIKKILDDSTTIKIAGSTLTVNNIQAQMDAAYAAVPKPLLFKYGTMGLKFHVSYATFQLWESAQMSLTFKSVDTTQTGIRKYKGYDVVALAGMPDNTIIVTISAPDLDSHLWLGLNSTDDDSNMKMMQVQNNSELWFIKMLMKADTQIGWGLEIVISTTITA